MALNFDPDRRSGQRREQRAARRFRRWSERFDRLSPRFKSLRARLRLRRSPNGIVLGVFRGIAESLGWSVCWTRVGGCIALLAVSGDGGHASLLVGGFFYLLAAVLMRPPEPGADRLNTSGSGHFHPDDEEEVDGPGAPYPASPAYPARPTYPAQRAYTAAPAYDPPPAYATRASRRAAAVPYQRLPVAPRVDFAALDRQLDALNQRIQRMEGVVTDRHYDWDRRMES